jgi:hypothetical protein
MGNFLMSKEEKEFDEEDDLDDLLDKELERQDQIHPRCRISDNTDERKKRWKEKYGT